MPFPKSTRVIYKNNPLQQVICQLRFPIILKIDAEIPFAFQEKLRASYPVVKEKRSLNLQIPQEIAQQLPQNAIDFLTKRAFDFSTEDDSWVVSLSSNFLALTCNRYERWEFFLERLQQVYSIFLEEYEPVYLTRIGLRYQNLVDKIKLGLEDCNWNELLNPSLASILSSTEVGANVLEMGQNILVNLEYNSSRVRIQHGIARNTDTKEIVGYLIDNDFFVEGRLEVESALDYCTNFNRWNRDLFRWSISEKLHSAMEPGDPD